MKTQILKATLLAFIIFFSCHQVSQQHPILEQAEKVMSEHPDSALFLLEQVAAPEKMPERDYATWCLLITEARDKNPALTIISFGQSVYIFFLFEVLYCDIDQGIRSMFDIVLITSLCY